MRPAGPWFAAAASNGAGGRLGPAWQGGWLWDKARWRRHIHATKVSGSYRRLAPLLRRRARGTRHGRRRARHVAGSTPQGDSERGTSGRATSGGRAWTWKPRVAGGLKRGMVGLARACAGVPDAHCRGVASAGLKPCHYTPV
jgi:hypothetical protein